MTPRYCTICRAEVTDRARLRRQSPYCSEGCRRVAKNEARAATAHKKCRLCSRRFYKPRIESRVCAPGARMDLMGQQIEENL